MGGDGDARRGGGGGWEGRGGGGEWTRKLLTTSWSRRAWWCLVGILLACNKVTLDNFFFFWWLVIKKTRSGLALKFCCWFKGWKTYSVPGLQPLLYAVLLHLPLQRTSNKRTLGFKMSGFSPLISACAARTGPLKPWSGSLAWKWESKLSFQTRASCQNLSHVRKITWGYLVQKNEERVTFPCWQKILRKY